MIRDSQPKYLIDTWQQSGEQSSEDGGGEVAPIFLPLSKGMGKRLLLILELAESWWMITVPATAERHDVSPYSHHHIDQSVSNEVRKVNDALER